MTQEELRQKITEIENRQSLSERNISAADRYAQTDGDEETKNLQSREAIRKAMNLLVHQPRTVRELSERLTRSGFSSEAVDAAISYVSSFGYLNDRKYAESYVMNAGSRKSRAALRSDLLGKGVGSADIDAALEFVETDERELAASLLAKRCGEAHRMNEAEKRRAWGYLGRRGFSPELIRSVLIEYQNSGLPD